MCKPVTRGTIEEDAVWNPENWQPFFQHYWPAWGDHTPWWRGWIDPDNALEYAPSIFNKAVQEFADGLEDEAFFDFGRLLHLLEDMGSVPHVFGDSHPALTGRVNWLDLSGYEKWSFEQRDLLHTSDRVQTVASFADAMQDLALETFRSARIAGRLHADLDDPVEGDLAQLFPVGSHVRYISKDASGSLVDAWWLDGVGYNFTGSLPVDPNRRSDDPFYSNVPNSWYRVRNLAHENGEYYYVENGQHTAVPASVWSVAAGGYVPNDGGLSLAHLWAGAGDLRATRDQAIETIPRTIEYTAGLMQHIWDFVNPPAHLTGVRVEQDRNGDGAIDIGAGELVYNRVWIEPHAPGAATRTARVLRGTRGIAGRSPARITLRFSEPVRSAWVALESGDRVTEITRMASSERGPPTPDHPLGEPILRLPPVDLSAFPDGWITVLVRAEDLSSHVNLGTANLDTDPSTRAGRLPDGSWRFWEDLGAFLPTDRNHSFQLGGFEVRASPPGGGVSPGGSIRHCVEVRNLTLPEGTEGFLTISGGSRGWTIDPSPIVDRSFLLPAPGGDWTSVLCPLVSASSFGPASSVAIAVEARTGSFTARAAIHDWATDNPLNDHPDDSQSVADRRYPTPWIVDPAAPIGLLLGGWGQGLGHMLGRYGIATAPVTRELSPLGADFTDLSHLKALFIGSGGLSGLDRSPSLRAKLANFVAEGGVLVALTPQRGTELEALPGGEVAGFGWSEDQACFGMAAQIVSRHVVLSGQAGALLDVGADGYLTRWPDEAQILLSRTGNQQPAMVRYPYGRGEVFVLLLYPDFGYGSHQSTAAERALIRDLATYALARPIPVVEAVAGEAAATTFVAVNETHAPTAAARIDIRTPDRLPLATSDIPLPLAPGDFAEAPLAFPATATLGIHPAFYRLLDEAGVARGTGREAGFFAVEIPFDLVAPPAGLRLWVTVANDAVPIGGRAAAVVHLRNGTDRELAGTIAATWTHLGAGPLASAPEVTVPAGGEIAVPLDYPVIAPYDFTLAYGFFARGTPPETARFYEASLAYAMKGFAVFTPRAGIALSSAPATLLPGHPFVVTAALRASDAGSLAVDLSLRLRSPSNREVWRGDCAPVLDPQGSCTFTIELQEAEIGLFTLEAEVRVGNAQIGAASLSFRRSPPALALDPRPTLPWRIGGANDLGISLRNDEAVALGEGLLRVALVGEDGAARWTETRPLPSLAPGAALALSFQPGFPSPMAQGDYRLRFAAELPEGATSGEVRYRHHVASDIVLDSSFAAAGGSLGADVSVVNRGDFLLAGTLALASAGLTDRCERTVAIPPGGSAAHTCGFAVPQDVAPGLHHLTAVADGVAGTLADVAFSVLPPRLEILAPAEEAASGGVLDITFLNTGGSLGVFDYRLHLHPSSALGGSGSPAALSEFAGSCELHPGADCSALLPIPSGLPTALYLFAYDATERRTGDTFRGDAYLLVQGVTAGLALATDRAEYASGESVTAVARVENGSLPLEGAVLELAITGSGGIDPPSYNGTVHVSPTGNDLTGDGSAANPYASIQRGIDAAPPGARVLLLAGGYSGDLIRLRAGTVLQGEVADGRPAARIEGTDLIGTAGVVVDHLELVDTNLIFPEGVSGVRITDCVLADLARTVDGFRTGVVFAGAAEDVLIGRTAFLRLTGSRLGVIFRAGARAVRLHECSFEDFSGFWLAGVQFLGGARDVVVQGCSFRGLAGSSAGIHLWGDGTPDSVADVALLNNRLELAPGDCNGIQVWDEAARLQVRGNMLADLDGACTGIHVWGRTGDTTLSDNRLVRLRGDAVGLHLWGDSSREHRVVSITNNLLEDFAPGEAEDLDNGLLVWERARFMRIAENRLARIADGDPVRLRSGLVVSAAGSSGVLLERNVVVGSPVGIALRLENAATVPGEASAVVANNLLLGNDVGILEETLVGGGASVFRDNIVMEASQAGIRYSNPSGMPAASAVRNNDFFANAAPAEGRADPLGDDGNFAADPQFVDRTHGDYRTLPGSPCREAGSLPAFDVGPHDDDLDIALAPRAVPNALLSAVHWQENPGVDLAPGGAAVLERTASSLAAAGQLALTGRLRTGSGQALAIRTALFTMSAEPLRLTLSVPGSVFRAGGPIPVTVVASNTGTAAIVDERLSVLQDGAEVFTSALALEGGETARLSFETSADRGFLLRAAAGLAAAELAIAIGAPDVDIEVLVPEEVGLEPFTLAARVANTGPVIVRLQLDLAGEPHDLELEPGEERVLARLMSVTFDTHLVVRCSGDVTHAVVKTVRCGVAPALDLRTQARYAAGPLTVPATLINHGTLGGVLPVRAFLGRSGETPRALAETRQWVDAGESAQIGLALGFLEPGSYRLRLETTGTAREADFAVVPAVRGRLCGAEPEGGADAEGRLALAVCVSNEGFETFLGTLSVSLGQAALERGVAIPPGAMLAERVQVPVTGLTAGEHRIAVELAGRNGPEDRLELTVPLAAELSLAGLPERGVLQGGATSSVGVRVRNAGSVAGRALLRLTGGDFIEASLPVSVAARADTEFTFLVATPDDLPDGLLVPATVVLVDLSTGSSLSEALTFEIQAAAALAVSGALDGTGYADGEEAQLTLSIANTRPDTALPARVLVSSGEHREWLEVVLGPSAVLSGVGAPEGGGGLGLDPGGASGSLTSATLDVRDAAGATLSWGAALPDGAALNFESRTGDSPIPDGSWSPWEVLASGEPTRSEGGRYLQYRATFTASPSGQSPRIHWIGVDCPASGMQISHAGREDFRLTPIQLTSRFTVDFSAADGVHYAVYGLSGRSLHLDTIPIPRRGANVTLWIGRSRFSCGETIQVWAWAFASGELEIWTPWEQASQSLAAGGSWLFPFEVPLWLRSGTYLIQASFLGEQITVPIEVSGYDLRVLHAELDRGQFLPGETARLSIEVLAEDELAGLSIDGWVADGASTVPVLETSLDLPPGPARLEFELPVPSGPAGPARLELRFSLSAGGQPRALFLAAAEVGFDRLGPNRAPTAHAGPDRAVGERSWVALDGTGSADPDGDRLTWRWEQTSGPAATIFGADTARPLLLAPPVGPGGERLVFALVVGDGRAESLPDGVEVAVSDANRPPGADAGPDFTLAVRERAALDGSSSFDPDGDLLSFHWEIVAAPEGSEAAPEDPSGVRTSFLADRPGEYDLRLTVSDGAAGGSDALHVSTVNSRPTADAGEGARARPGERVTLDGSGSFDPDEDPLTFSWTLLERPAGSAAALEEEGTERPTFVPDLWGTYVAALRVRDGALESETDTVVVSCENAAPVADAGPDRAVRAGQAVQLDGSGSSDADGDEITWEWTLAAMPSASEATLAGGATSAPTLVPDREGSYLVSLVVDDGFARSAPDGVVVTAGPEVAEAAVVVKPARFRLASPPRRLKVSIELGEGFAAAEIDADAAAITAVGTRRLPAPVRRDAAVAPSLVDGDRDGLPELVVAFPAKPLLKRLKAGRANRLALEGPLTTWGRFVGSAALRVLP